MKNREVGGYIEFEHYHGKMMHDGAVALNCGRNCLAYLIEAKRIKKILLPYFDCDSVANVCKRYPDLKVSYYHIQKNDKDYIIGEFEHVKLEKSEWLYLINYYGMYSDKDIEVLHERFSNLIVDNSQAYFQNPVQGVDTIYTCRKFFGVADGAFLYTDQKLGRELPQDESHNRMGFLLGRFERTASEFYKEYAYNNDFFAGESIKRMSSLTENLLRGIDYAYVNKIRKENFAYLHEKLGHLNKFPIRSHEGPFMYPLWIEGGAEIREKLKSLKIYIPILWPDVFDICKEDELEYQMAKDILPLPLDQRYSIDTMKYMIEEILKCIN